jgi:UDP-N-acetyl-D-glucosamine dehydrogenase
VKPSKVVVIGQGYVGLPLALAIAEAGHEVVGFDLNQDLVRNLNSGRSHIEDVQDTDLENLIKKSNYKSTSNPSDFAESDIAIIAVPTPLNSKREPDVSFVESASEILGKHLFKGALIINESTSYPGTLRSIIVPAVEKYSPSGVKHEFAISPERVDPGNKNWKIKNTPRLYAGLTPEAAKKTKDFYSTFCDTIIELSSPETAEAAKLFENTFRQVNIALVNEFSLICHKLGINVHEVLDGAATKPYGFMKFSPGIGVGGHCIPVDPTFLSFAANKAGADSKFIDLANEVNFKMPKKIIEELSDRRNDKIEGKTILIVGISYKLNIADIRESPTLRLIEELRSKGNKVYWHDPLVKTWNGESSLDLHDISKIDFTIISILHDVIDRKMITKSKTEVYDLTGTLKEIKTF